MSEDIPYEKWAYNDNPPRGPWRGTRSCPRDGTRFLVWRDFDQRTHIAAISERGTWSIHTKYHPEVVPDYWMPCPDSPETFAAMAAA